MTEPAARQHRGTFHPDAWTPGRRVLCALASGLLLVGAFPPFDAGWLAPVAFAGWALSLRGARGRMGALAGASFGLAFMGTLQHWLWMSAGVLAWVALTLLQASFFALAGWGSARASRGGRCSRVVAIPFVWTAVEITRARIPWGGFTWGDAGLTQVEGPLNGYAPWGGAHLVGLVVVLLGVLIAEVLTDRTLLRRAALGVVGLLVVGATLPAGAGPVVGTFDIAAVQGNVPRERFVIRRGRTGPEDEVVVRNHLAATERLVGSAPPDLVVWPENAFDVDPRDRPDLFGPTRDLIARVGAPFLIGAILGEGDRFTNTNLQIAVDGTIVGRYDKMHLVPMGEYVPLRFLRDLVPILNEEIPTDGAPGDTVKVFDVGGRRVGSVICFESSYPGLVRRFVAEGAELIVVSTNNASFGTSPAAAQHLAHSRMRAIENGRAVAHAAIAGISALILPDGSVIDRAELFTQDVLRAQLPLHRGKTPYTRWGGAFEVLLLLAGVAAVAVPRRGRSA